MTLIEAERNYDIYDLELLTIVKALHNWQPFLAGSPHIITVHTDHAIYSTGVNPIRSADGLPMRSWNWPNIMWFYNTFLEKLMEELTPCLDVPTMIREHTITRMSWSSQIPYCYNCGKDSCWVSNVYYSVWINYTWTMTHSVDK